MTLSLNAVWKETEHDKFYQRILLHRKWHCISEENLLMPHVSSSNYLNYKQHKTFANFSTLASIDTCESDCHSLIYFINKIRYP